MAQLENPVPFNPDSLTLRQVRDCAETLRWLYQSMDRLDAMEAGEDKENFLANLLYHIRQGREQYIKAWRRG